MYEGLVIIGYNLGVSSKKIKRIKQLNGQIMMDPSSKTSKDGMIEIVIMGVMLIYKYQAASNRLKTLHLKQTIPHSIPTNVLKHFWCSYCSL